MFINRQLIEFAKGSHRLFIAVSMLETIAAVMATLIIFLTSIVVRMLLDDGNIPLFTDIWQPFVLIIVLILLRFALSKARTVKSIECSIKVKSSLRTRLMEKLLELGPAYTVKQRTGEIVTTIWARVERLNDYYSKYVPAVIAAISNAIFVLIVMFAIDWVVGLSIAIASFGVLVSPLLFYRMMRKYGNSEWRANAKYFSDCLDGIQGVSSLKAFNANGYQRKKIHKQGELLRMSIMKHLNVTIAENCVLAFFAWTGTALTVVVAVFRHLNGFILPEMLIYILFLATACFRPMFNMITAWHMGYRGVTGAESISKMLSAQADISLVDGVNKNFPSKAVSLAEQPETISSGVAFESVSFAYSQDAGDVLHDISFEIPGGTTMALVGSSGGGKSTIASLLSGFYKPNHGKIMIGCHEINEGNVREVQSLIAAVWQDSCIFYGSCLDNILMGKPTATTEEVVEAAKAANIHDMIMGLEDGYDTLLGERGARLSGGERQRLAIARAFLRNASIVIFDEATSALDRSNEKAVQAAFAKLKTGKTALVIAHRLDTIKNAEQICVIDKGKIAAVGTHDELQGSSMIYKKLMANQLSYTGKGDS